MAVTIINNAAPSKRPDNRGKVHCGKGRQNTNAQNKKKAGGKRKRVSRDEQLYGKLERLKLFCASNSRLPSGKGVKGQPQSDEAKLGQFIYNLRRSPNKLEDAKLVAYINAIDPKILGGGSKKRGKKKRKITISKDDRFQNNLDLVREFFILRQRLPYGGSSVAQEQKLGYFINDCRKYQRAGTLSDARKDAINDVHPGILSYHKTNSRKRKASPEWEIEFAKAASRTTIQQVRSHGYPSDGVSYVPVHPSAEEHMIRETGACFKFKPSDCNPGTTSKSTIQDVMSYALYPDRRKRDYEGGDTVPTFTPNVVDDPKRSSNHRSGSLFPSNNVPSRIKELMAQVEELLMPNDLIGRLQACCNFDEFDALMKENEHIFDTFNFGDGGLRVDEKVVNIFDTHFPQPRRQSYSTYAGPPRPCPSLLDLNGEAVHLQELLMYGATGRPILDTRCRPMDNLLYNLSVEVWKHVWEQLSPLSQVCPPLACVGMMYSWVKSGRKGVKDMKGEMRPHHDNRHKPNTNQAIGANNEEDSNSHMHGSDVIVVTFGDDMEYQMIRPNHKKKQTYANMTQTQALANRSAQRKNNNLSLMKTMSLGNGSIYVHTCDDDDLYYHALEFLGQLGKNRSKVRFALVFRWLTKSAYFRQSAADHRGNRYSMIDKKAMKDLDKMPKSSDKWWRSMQYLDDDGNNTLKQLMDPK